MAARDKRPASHRALESVATGFPAAEHEELSGFFELSEDLLCVAGANGYFRHLSPSWSDVLGFTIDELMAIPFAEFLHPDDRERTAQQFVRVARDGRATRFENRYRHRDGSYRSLSWNAIPGPERGMVYAVARWTDPQIEAERALRDSEERFRSAFDDAIVGMYMATPAGRFVRVNEAFATMLGRSAHELIGVHFSEVTHPEDVGGHSAMVQDVLSGMAPGFHDERRYLRPDGTVITAMVSTTLVRNSQGEPSHFVAQMLDITAEKEAAAELAATVAMLDGIVQNSQSLIYVKDLEGTYLLANKALQDAYGVTEAEIVGHDDRVLDPERELAWRADDLRAREGAFRIREWSGQGDARRWYESVKFPLHDGSGAVYATCGVALDVTELHRQRKDAARAAAFASAVLAASPDAIVVDKVAGGRPLYSSRGSSGVIGSADADDDGQLIPPASYTADERRLADAFEAARRLEDGQVLQVRYATVNRAGEHRWLSRRITPFRRDDVGQVVEIVSVVRDVTEMVAAEDQLAHAALHDPLTGLPNRTLLTDRLTGALSRARRHHQEVAVLFCDLDSFKRVNDSAGHAVGDRVLIETGRRLQECVRELDTVSRVGGDEFVIIVEPLNHHGIRGPVPPTRELGESVARRIVAALAEPFIVDDIEHAVTASVGLAFAGGDDERSPTAEDVLRTADAAMYRAKSRGKDRFEVSHPGQQIDLTERSRVESILRGILAAPAPTGPHGDGPGTGTLGVEYQPIFEADTGQLKSFEALARLTDAHGTAVQPDAFIPVAEEVGLIRPLGTRVLREACESLARWRTDRADAADITIAVNLSGRQAQHPALTDEVLTALADAHLSPDRLVLELTESVLMYAGSSTLKMFRSLRETGVGIHIDDFGTGYASLRYIAEFPVTGVKIDRGFTAGLPGDPVSGTIVRAVAGLARDLHLECIVEGIETPAQRDALPSGVSLQGFLLGPPAASIDAAALLGSSRT